MQLEKRSKITYLDVNKQQTKYRLTYLEALE